jgi:hypothetical protein
VQIYRRRHADPGSEHPGSNVAVEVETGAATRANQFQAKRIALALTHKRNVKTIGIIAAWTGVQFVCDLDRFRYSLISGHFMSPIPDLGLESGF